MLRAKHKINLMHAMDKASEASDDVSTPGLQLRAAVDIARAACLQIPTSLTLITYNPTLPTPPFKFQYP